MVDAIERLMEEIRLLQSWQLIHEKMVFEGSVPQSVINNHLSMFPGARAKSVIGRAKEIERISKVEVYAAMLKIGDELKEKKALLSAARRESRGYGYPTGRKPHPNFLAAARNRHKKKASQ